MSKFLNTIQLNGVDVTTNSDTQTLTNKTITSPALGGTVTGTYTLGGTPTLLAAGALTWVGRSQITSPANGSILLQNNAGTDFTSLQFGGTTSSFPMLKRSGTFLQLKLANDSGFAFLECESLYIRHSSTSKVVEVGDEDSGGSGYRLLRITN